MAKKLTEDKESCQTVDYIYDYKDHFNVVSTKVGRCGLVHDSRTESKAAPYISQIMPDLSII